MKTTIGMLATLLAAVACSNADPTAPAQADEVTTQKKEQPLEADAPAASATTTQQVCRGFMQRLRACGPTFIPALVEARVKSNDPPNIAALDAKIGRAALVEQAFEEWASDSSDPSIDAKCDYIAQAVLASGRDEELRSGVGSCMASPGCDTFVACSVPLNLRRWQEPL